jgi:predicted Zn-dependent protease
VACAPNPATGKSEFMLVSEEQEIAMGRQEAQKVLATMPLYEDKEAQDLVKRIGMEMAAASERPHLPWEFHVLDDETVNAFALPGGFIFITRGIMSHMNSEAELASVIGHEIGHVTGRHSAQQMTNAQLAQTGLLAGMILSQDVRNAGGALTQGLGLLFLKFGRDDESEADMLGFRYMTYEGYDTRAAATMFQTLDRASASAGQRLPEWQSTHPDPANRVEKALARVDSVEAAGRDLSGATLNQQSYLQLLDGMVYGLDPVKQGYFKDGAFYHPQMRIQFAFPAGWKTQNKPEGVVAVSPPQDAIMQLGHAGKAGASKDAAQKFFGQEGLQTANLNTNSVNGLTAASGDFRGQMEDGKVIDGSASFIEHGQSTFVFMGYTTQGNQAQLAAIKSAIRTFKPLTDRRFIDVTPATIKLVAVPKDMTVDQFNRQFPSSIPVGELAVMNGLDDETSILKAGRLAKRVVGGSK